MERKQGKYGVCCVMLVIKPWGFLKIIQNTLKMLLIIWRKNNATFSYYSTNQIY